MDVERAVGTGLREQRDLCRIVAAAPRQVEHAWRMRLEPTALSMDTYAMHADLRCAADASRPNENRRPIRRSVGHRYDDRRPAREVVLGGGRGNDRRIGVG